MDNVNKYKIGNNLRTIILVALITIIVIIAIFILYFFNIESYDISGNKNYTQEEIETIIFDKPYEKNTLYVYFDNIFGKKKTIPFVETYDIQIQWPNKVVVTIYEKAITAYIEYMGVNMFFDKDGIIVESSTKLPEDIPLVCGLNFDYMQLYQKLAVENENVFNVILAINQCLTKYDVKVDKIQFDKSYNVTLYKDNIKILLGDGTNVGERIYRLSLVMNKFEGLKGTLYLNDFNENDGDILFKKEE